MAQVKGMASPPDTYPMVIVPYLSADKLEELQAAGVSGLDLCGNGVIVVPGKMLIFRSGQPNRFPQSAKLRNIYRGRNSLVARAFLIRPRFAQVKEIVGLLGDRGGGVAFSTVSKALQQLQEDLIISRKEGLIRLIQPEMLLDKLAANYAPPTITERFRGKCELPREEIARRLNAGAASSGVKVVLTGASSAERFAVTAGEPATSFYCTGMPPALLSDVKETDRFANVELLRTDEDRVYFDTRDENGIPFASPIQSWLELVTGDKRQKDAGEQVKRGILELLGAVATDGNP